MSTHAHGAARHALTHATPPSPPLATAFQVLLSTFIVLALLGSVLLTAFFFVMRLCSESMAYIYQDERRLRISDDPKKRMIKKRDLRPFDFAPEAPGKEIIVSVDANGTKTFPAPHALAGPFHVFLSHNWKHGQSEMRVIKTRLKEMIPEVQVFLDVDQLASGSSDYPHIDMSDVVLCYLTKNWFTSFPCVREITRAMVMREEVATRLKADKSGEKSDKSGEKCPPRLIALIEPDGSDQHGGMTIDQVKTKLLSPEYRERLKKDMEPEVRKWVKDLDLKAPTPAEIVEALPEDIVKALLEAKDEPPIVWSRLTDHQDVSMRLIAERLLKKQPERKYMMKHTITERVREHYHVDKTGKKKLQLKNKRDDCEFNLYVSEFLPKRAHDIATWLVDNIEGFKVCSKGNCEQLKKCEHILVHLSAKTWEDRRFVHEVMLPAHQAWTWRLHAKRDQISRTPRA